MKHWMAFGLALVLSGCGGESASDGTGGSAGTGAGGASGGAGGAGGSGGAGGATGGSGGADACQDPNLKTCNGPAQCVLATSNCCLCGKPEITDFVAMNQASASQCACQGPMCGCATMLNPNLAASCESGTCAAWDVRSRADYAGCKDDSDCRLRDGLGCCETCAPIAEQLVAVRTDSEAALKGAMCSAGMACSKCMIQYPANAKAVCNAGYCQVAISN